MEMYERIKHEASEVNTSGTRDYALDNIRFFLIFCVVFGHLLEAGDSFAASSILYKIIYSFHMPAFLLLFGYNIKYSCRRILLRFCIPYFVFQTVYIVYDMNILKGDEVLQYTTPYWILWYLLVCIFYQLLIPLYDIKRTRYQIVIISLAFAIALLIGFEKTVGEYMSLSRFFVFQPWFLLGFYCKKNEMLKKGLVHDKMHFISRISVYGIIVSFVYLLLVHIPNRLLYGSYPYNKHHITIDKRAILMVISLCWILFLFVVIKPYLNKKIPMITTIGQNTLPVYLMHGFVVKTIPVFFPVLLSTPWSILLLSCVILLVFGNKVCQKGIYYLCFGWLEKYIK